MSAVHRLLDAALDLLYPPRCQICHALIEPREKPVCRKCLDTLPEHEGADPRVEGASRCVATFFYTGDLRESFHRYKFGGMDWYARLYGQWMAVTVRDRLAGAYDLLSWAPVSRKRLKSRGYDQALLLAQSLGRELGLAPVRTLEKHTDNPAQSGLDSAQARAENTRGVYRAYNAAAFRGKRILLIDDIVTTGATLSECCRTLRAAGAADVVCAALATPTLLEKENDR